MSGTSIIAQIFVSLRLIDWTFFSFFFSATTLQFDICSVDQARQHLITERENLRIHETFIVDQKMRYYFHTHYRNLFVSMIYSRPEYEILFSYSSASG